VWFLAASVASTEVQSSGLSRVRPLPEPVQLDIVPLITHGPLAGAPITETSPETRPCRVLPSTESTTPEPELIRSR
jgi:hypothetical protein